MGSQERLNSWPQVNCHRPTLLNVSFSLRPRCRLIHEVNETWAGTATFHHLKEVTSYIREAWASPEGTRPAARASGGAALDPHSCYVAYVVYTHICGLLRRPAGKHHKNLQSSFQLVLHDPQAARRSRPWQHHSPTLGGTEGTVAKRKSLRGQNFK